MGIAGYFTHSITRYRIENANTFDIYGNPEEVETSVDLKGWVSQLTTTEQSIDRSTTVATYVIYFPTGTDVVSTDVLEWEDIRMRIVGQPQQAYTPTQGVHHIELTAVKVIE